jgi:hypothetical protein
MARRRRRQGRRERHVDTDRPAAHPPDRGAAKAEARKRGMFELKMARLRRIRSIIGALGFVPLVASLLCSSGVEAFCFLPREIWLGVWAALFGSFIGLTVRMWRERRRFERTGALA